MKKIEDIYNSYLSKKYDERVSIGIESYSRVFKGLSKEFCTNNKKGIDIIIIAILRSFLKADGTFDKVEFDYLKKVLCFEYTYEELLVKLEKPEIIKGSYAGLTLIKQSDDIKLRYHLLILALLVCVANNELTKEEIKELNTLL